MFQPEKQGAAGFGHRHAAHPVGGADRPGVIAPVGRRQVRVGLQRKSRRCRPRHEGVVQSRAVRRVNQLDGQQR